MKKILFIISIVSLLLVGITQAGAYSFFKKGNGKLGLNITDTPSELNITKAFMTISRIDVHSVVISGNKTFGKWYTVAEGPLTFDLMTINASKEPLGNLTLTAGWYTQIRLYVDKANITIDGKEYDLKVPSGKVRIIRPFRILDNQTTNLTLNFDLQKSIHSQGKNKEKYMMRPVIKIIKE